MPSKVRPRAGILSARPKAVLDLHHPKQGHNTRLGWGWGGAGLARRLCDLCTPVSSLVSEGAGLLLSSRILCSLERRVELRPLIPPSNAGHFPNSQGRQSHSRERNCLSFFLSFSFCLYFLISHQRSQYEGGGFTWEQHHPRTRGRG